MPWGWGGRGFRWMFWLTGLPGWARFGYGYPYGYPYSYAATYPRVAWQYNWFWRCRWFPWLPRWWWTGMYGPVQWTPQGPILTQQPTSTQWTPTFTQQPTQPINEIEALKQEKQILEQELKDIEKRLKELEERK